MDPRTDETLILGYLEGDLPAGERARVDALCDAAPAFGALLDGLARDRTLLRTAPPAEPPAGLADAAVEQLERDLLLDDRDTLATLPAGRRRRLPLVAGWAAAAALAAAAGGALFVALRPPGPVPPVAQGPAPEPFDIASAPIETQRKLARRDGAEIAFDIEAAPAAGHAPPPTPAEPDGEAPTAAAPLATVEAFAAELDLAPSSGGTPGDALRGTNARRTAAPREASAAPTWTRSVTVSAAPPGPGPVVDARPPTPIRRPLPAWQRWAYRSAGSAALPPVRVPLRLGVDVAPAANVQP